MYETQILEPAIILTLNIVNWSRHQENYIMSWNSSTQVVHAACMCVAPLPWAQTIIKKYWVQIQQHSKVNGCVGMVNFTCIVALNCEMGIMTTAILCLYCTCA